jgi:hypothetical protein
MATATVSYSSNTAITMDLANLGSSTTFVAGRESSQIDNTTNKYIDCIVSGSVSVGTNPTVNRVINVYVWGADTSLATAAIDVLDGTDSAETLTNTGVLASLRYGAGVSVTAATSDVAYPVLPFSVAALFGGVMPKFWGLFVAHDTVAALRNTAVNTNSFEFVGVKYDIA